MLDTETTKCYSNLEITVKFLTETDEYRFTIKSKYELPYPIKVSIDAYPSEYYDAVHANGRYTIEKGGVEKLNLHL